MIAALFAMATPAPHLDDFLTETKTYREERQLRLTRERGWLSVAGLFWLKEGRNVAGDGADADVHLPAGSLNGTFGTFVRSGDKVTFEAGSVPVTRGEEKLTQAELTLDRDLLKSGRLTISAIKRGDRIGLRLWDNEAPTRVHFKGLNWFKADPKYVVKAKFLPFAEPKQVPILNILGDTEQNAAPGEVLFTINGHEQRLLALDGGDELFFNFQDATSGKSTYGAGRFLYAPKAKDGFVTLDFNRAENPPCAYTAFATCPLPPKGNRLTVAIEAGEKKYDTSH